jgi:hypothetical protein
VALFNESLQARYNEFIRRAHGMKGSPAPQVSPEIGHEIVIEDDRLEHLALASGISWGFHTAVAAQATHVSVVGVRNPTAGGYIVVVTAVRLYQAQVPAAVSAMLKLRDLSVQSTIAAAGNVTYRDTRLARKGQTTAAIQVLSDNANFVNFAAFIGSELEQVSLLAGEGARDCATIQAQTGPGGGVVLAPGFDLALVTTAINTATEACFSGYAIPAHPEILLT